MTSLYLVAWPAQLQVRKKILHLGGSHLRKDVAAMQRFYLGPEQEMNLI